MRETDAPRRRANILQSKQTEAAPHRKRSAQELVSFALSVMHKSQVLLLFIFPAARGRPDAFPDMTLIFFRVSLRPARYIKEFITDWRQTG